MTASGRVWEANPWRLARWTAIAALLSLPLVAMQFTGEVAWTAFDFAVAAILLVGAEAAYELASRHVHERKRRLIIAAALILAVMLIWAQGAVGIFD